jgi:hypothetical protein
MNKSPKQETKSKNKNFAGVYRDEVNVYTGKIRMLLKELITTVNFADNPDFLFENTPFPLKRGQLITSLKTLSDLTGYSVQTIRTTLKNLTKLQILTDTSTGILTNKARLITFIDIDKWLVKQSELTNDLTTPPTNDQQTGNKRVTTNNNDNNNQEEINNEKQINVDSLFEEFWNLFPEKRSKKKAREKYEKLYKQHDAIIAGVKKEIHYREWMKKKKDRDPKANIFIPFWKHPTTWLNQECWKDEFTKDFDSEMKRIEANERAREAEKQGEIIKQADSIYHKFKVEYLNNKLGVDNWKYFDVIGNQELMKEINEEFMKKYPKESKILDMNT